MRPAEADTDMCSSGVGGAVQGGMAEAGAPYGVGAEEK